MALAPAQLQPGASLGDYEIVSIAGAGGMGVVYQARQRSLGRMVALKVIREEVAGSLEYRERFLREARLAASVDHPHVVSIYDVCELDQWLFLVLQWIDGDDLKRVIETSGRLSADRAVTIAAQLASALDAVHRAGGLVHRDVKPANVLVRQVEAATHCYLTDFGIAKPSERTDQLTQTGWVVGTAGYLSPEQIRGHEPGPRSDLYALGCLLYEALTGRPPFVAANDMALRWAHANDPRPLVSLAVPELGTRYDRFIATALSIDPAQRFASGRQFAENLAEAHDDGRSENAAMAGRTPVPHPPTAVGPPTPMPPMLQTPPPTPMPNYGGYGYAAPAPAPQQRSGNPLALILLALLALVGIAAGLLAAAGVFAHPASGRSNVASASNRASSRLPGATRSQSRSAGAQTPPAAGQSGSSQPRSAGSSNLASPGAARVATAASAALQRYWMLVNTGQYAQAWEMETAHEQGEEPSFLSDKNSERPMINVVSIGPASSDSVAADVPIAFYALDRYPTSSADMYCKYFEMTAHMIQGSGGSWFYDGPVPGTAQVTTEPGSTNCHS
jgi:serine/threonine protein kinase